MTGNSWCGLCHEASNIHLKLRINEITKFVQKTQRSVKRKMCVSGSFRVWLCWPYSLNLKSSWNFSQAFGRKACRHCRVFSLLIITWSIIMMIYILWWSVCLFACHEKSSLPTSELWPRDDDDDYDGDDDELFLSWARWWSFSALSTYQRGWRRWSLKFISTNIRMRYHSSAFFNAYSRLGSCCWKGYEDLCHPWHW